MLKKGFIPLIVAGVLTLGSAGAAYYLGTKITFKENLGEKETEDFSASNPDTLLKKLKKIVVHDGDYYAALENAEQDPEPTPNAYNNISIEVTGSSGVYGSGEYHQRTLTVTQSHLGACYQYQGSQDTSGISIDQGVSFSWSREGMFTWYSGYAVHATEDGGSVPAGNLAIRNGIQSHRGDWYEVKTTHVASEYTAQDEINAFNALDNYITKFRNDSVKSMNDNKGVIDFMINVLQNPRDEALTDASNKIYVYNVVTADNTTIKVKVNLSDSSKPNYSFDVYDEQNRLKEHQNMTIQYANNDFNPNQFATQELKAGDYHDVFFDAFVAIQH